MRKIYYIIDSLKSKNYTSDTLCLLYLDMNQDLEQQIDLSLIDFLHENIKMYITSETESGKEKAKELALKYDAEYSEHAM